MKLMCPRCQSARSQIKAGLNRSRSQRYQCLGCRRKYTPERKGQGHAGAVRQQAVRQQAVRQQAVRQQAVRQQAVRQQAVRYTLEGLSEGLSQRKVARLLGIAPQSVANWLALASTALQAQHGSEVPAEVAVPGGQVVEMDELSTFCGAKRGQKTSATPRTRSPSRPS